MTYTGTKTRSSIRSARRPAVPWFPVIHDAFKRGPTAPQTLSKPDIFSMIHIEHPIEGKMWECSSCSSAITAGLTCPDCYAVLCGVCAADNDHVVPAGERAGRRCGAPAIEAAA